MTPWPPCCKTLGVDHGGTHVPVSRKGLFGADIRTTLQEMSGEAVPERMCADLLVDSRFADGLGNGIVDGVSVSEDFKVRHVDEDYGENCSFYSKSDKIATVEFDFKFLNLPSNTELWSSPALILRKQEA